MMKKLDSFTIAEIVVAMTVLGGIALILMPSLVNNTQQQITDTTLNKTYSTLQQNARSIGLLVSRGQIAATTPEGTFFDALQATAKIVDRSKDVAYFENYTTDVTGNNLFSSQAKVLDASSVDTVVLKNGVFVSNKTVDGTGYIVVDTNGLRAPNKVGEDIFFFTVNKSEWDGTYSVRPAQGTCKKQDDATCKENKTCWKNRIGCTKERLKL